MRKPASDERDPLARPGLKTIAAAPEGHDARLVALTTAAAGRDHLHIARDDRRMAQFAEVARFFVPGLEVIELPAWDCLPYDRVSPNPEISARRLTALTHLARPGAGGPRLAVTTVNAALQRVPARGPLAAAVFAFEPGQAIDRPALTRFLDRCGYVRAGTVLEPGEFAVRGGLIDIFPAGAEHPVRLDLFGDEIESIRTFDALSQRTLAKTAGIELIPVSEVALDEAAIGRFQARYRELFGIVTGEDPLFEAVGEGRRHAGMEHWLPLFHPRLDTIFDYLPRAAVTLDYLADDARQERLETIQDYYKTRKQALAAAPRDAGAYKPIPPDLLYLDEAAWQAGLTDRAVGQMSPYDAPDGGPDQWHAGGRPGRDLAPERAGEGVNVYDVLARHVRAEIAAGRRVVMASYSAGARERLEGLLRDHGLEALALVENAAQAAALPAATVALAVLGLEHGFAAADLGVISEQDVLGDRLVRSRASARRAENFIAEASQLAEGDLVVHVDHGVGRYRGLKTIDAAGAPHDCVALVYDGGDRLFLPVENIEMLSRFGSGDGEAALDRLGSGHWQQRKARLKQRLKDMAEDLIRIAADRALKTADPCQPPAGLMAEFCARFAYQETEDQARAIADVTADLASGRPMDRLVCGDVGFGKTEVALRTAFAVSMEGAQVALVCPTTLLARQHFKTFSERFAGLPVRIAELSRLTPAATARRLKDDLAEGRLEIVIGTHALLAKGIRFAHLGLIIIDEEQHFGVRHKERLKQLRSAAHVLTLTATPIPRTLQLAMTGIRELSLIATPPVDRLAVRTFVLPFDAVVVREALLREHYRGGQSFYVCPRVSDLPEAEKFRPARCRR